MTLGLRRGSFILLLLGFFNYVYGDDMQLAVGISAYYSKSDTVIHEPVGFHDQMKQLESSAAVFPFTILDDSLIVHLSDYDSIFQKKILTFIAVGDIMPGTDYPSESYLPSDCGSLFLPAYDFLHDADLTIGNLEGVFSSDAGTPKHCNNPESCYVFRMPDEYAQCIKDAGFDVLSVANNHVNDFGYQGRMNTAKLLEEHQLHFAGFSTHPFTRIEVSGISIGFCAFSPHTGTMSLKDYEGARKIVSMLEETSDLVIVSFHGGAEGKGHQHVTKEDEVFLGYNRGNVHHFAREVVDAGADIVIGHGPHVVRAAEIYLDKPIFYSLGNFCTYRRFNLSGPNAFAPAVKIWMDEDGTFIKAKIFSFIQKGEGGPIIDPDDSAKRKIRELSIMDFPKNPVFIDEEGWIYPESENSSTATKY